ARKRRSAETHNRNPTSSFRRRFLVGVKIFEKNVMWQRRRCGGKIHPTAPLHGQSLIIMPRSKGSGNAGNRAGWRVGFGLEFDRGVSATTISTSMHYFATRPEIGGRNGNEPAKCG